MEENILIPGAILIFVLAIAILIIASQWRIYTKAGKPGWACIVPIYNIVVLLEIVKKPLWWIVLFVIPIVNWVMIIILAIQLAKAFNKNGGFAVGLILLPIIFYPILAFGKAEYVYDDKTQSSSDLLDN